MDVCMSDTELTIKLALFFCIDIQHCDVCYENVLRKHIAYSNAKIKWMNEDSNFLHWVPRSVPLLAFLSSPQNREKGRTSHLTFYTIQYNITENCDRKIAIGLKQHLSDRVSPKWSENYSLHKGSIHLLHCTILSGVSIAFSTPYKYCYKGQWVLHNLSQQLNRHEVCVFNLSTIGQPVSK